MRGEINQLWFQTRQQGDSSQEALLVRQQDLIMRNQVRKFPSKVNRQVHTMIITEVLFIITRFGQ